MNFDNPAALQIGTTIGPLWLGQYLNRSRRGHPEGMVNGSVPIHLARIALAFLFLWLLVMQRAKADAFDTFNLSAGISAQHDNNLFRLAPGADPNTVLGKSTKADDITVASLDLNLSKRYSLQYFALEASVQENRYRTFDYLNYTAFNYAASWQWSLTPYLYGTLSSDRREALNSFGYYTDYQVRNLRTDQIQHLEGVLEVGNAWRILGGVLQATRTNSETFNEEDENRLDSAEGGLRYDFSSGSSLGYVARRGRGVFFNRSQPIYSSQLDNRFDQSESEIRLIWPVTWKTTIDARAAHLDRRHAHFSDRDYAGNVGHLRVNWQITDKTSMLAGIGRELSSYQSSSSSYIRTDRFTLSPSWQIGTKTKLRGRYDYARRSFHGAIEATPSNGRIDTQRLALVALDWQPLYSLVLSALVRYDTRSSNQPENDYSSTMAGVSAQLQF